MTKPLIIPLPAYLGSDRWLIALAKRLQPFADGDPDVTDEPCERAQAAINAITAELHHRDNTLVLNSDDTISAREMTMN